MARGSKNKKQTRPARPRTLLLSALTAAALASGLGSSGVRPAQAAGYVYQPHTLNAGVLVTRTAALGAGPQYDPAPYLFYVLNNRPDVRPVDLNLVNPLAPAGVQPSSAAYWEVSLNSVSDSQLAQYNVLYLPAGGVTFQPNVNEKLRRFVDGGGQLIVEYGSQVPNSASTPPVLGLLFTGTGASGTSANAALPTSGTFLRHPIISQPYLLSGTDVAALTASASSAGYISANTNDSVHKGEFSSLFSPALSNGTGTLAAAAQIGAGQVVATTLSLGLGISVNAAYQNSTTNAYIFNPVNLYAASTPDLKLLANILTWSETHPSENKTSHGNASSTGLASFSPAWQYALVPPASASAPSGAAVWGNFVFAVDVNGALRAFDAYPSENLTGAATAGDDGVTDYGTGSSYDEIWQQAGFAGASTPTVASFSGVNYVFLEKNDGTLAAFNAVTGAAYALPAAPAASTTNPSVYYSAVGITNAPAPTIYDGRLYAGQANGTLHVYDLNEGTPGVAVTLDPNTPASGTSEAVTAAPSVGLLADGNTNVLVAVVPTTLNVYTVLLGGRNEPLVPYPSFGAPSGFSISRQGRYDLTNIFADVNTSGVPTLVPYNYNGLVLGGVPANNSAPQDPLFMTAATGGYFTDWNMDFMTAAGTSMPGTPVNLNFIAASPYGELSSASTSASPAAISAVAIARNGDYYYTETLGTNSYLVGVTNATLFSRVHLKFRFRMPTAADAARYPVVTSGVSAPWNYVDADGVNYNTSATASLVGYHFVGAPVVDDQDNVYVAAANGTSATVLSFQGDQQVSASTTAAVDLTSDTITQPDENGGEVNTIARGDGTETFGQFLGSETSIQFYNFGRQGQTSRQIAGDLTEPQPLMATSPDPAAAASTTTLLMHTNLSWFVAPFAVTGSISGLTQVGSSLLLTDGANLYRLPTNPLVGTGRVVTTGPSIAPIGAGTVASPPSVGGSVLVVNGTNGIAARTRQVTVIADNNRILGVDGDGNAVWAVDATTRTDASQTPSVTTKVGFSHPTALSQFAPNDYLVADPGTNRCVRFDSAGNVQWELTRFQDPQGLMGAGQPLTLSQPSSVVTRTAVVPSGAAQYVGDTATYYLVADSGNNRIVEVTDFVSSTGVTDGNHILTWVSHTSDRYGRAYRYGSAAYYANPATAATGSGISIAATVTNTRLAPLTASGGLGAVSGDAPGGSLVVFNYPANPQPFSSTPTPANDLVYTTAGFYAKSASGGYTPFTIRDPRFLQLYTPSPASSPTSPVNAVAPFDFLYADDNGAFDLSYDVARSAFVASPDRLQFTAPSYQSMTQPAVGVTGTISRVGLPFIPTCVQELSSDIQGTVTTRRYLITQNYSQGELGTLAANGNGKIGGEVFEADVTYPFASPATQSTTTPGGFGVNATLSHPGLTGPLTQPTYAVRLP